MRWLRRVPFTASYAVLLALTGGAVRLLDRDARAEVVRAASTNLANLGHGHVETLLVSAVVQAEPRFPALLPVVAALAAAEVVLGWRRTLVVFLSGHIGATVVVAVALAVGALPGVVAARVRDAVDTGPSYGTAAVIGAGLLVALLRALRRPGPRRAVGAMVVGVALGLAVLLTLLAVAEQPSFTAWGHLIALLGGAGAGVVLARTDRPARVPA